MKTSQFDAATGGTFTAEIDGPSFSQRIIGDGFFIIVNPNSKHVSFSKSRHDICFGDIVSAIIPEYTNQQFADDYGDRMLAGGQTVREYMRENCRMEIK